MNQSWSSEFSHLLERLFGEAQGSPPFMIISAIALGSMVLFAWCITNFICSARKGLIVSFFSQAIPGLIAVIAWIALQRNVVPSIESPGFKTLVPIIGAVLTGVIASWLTTKKLLGVSGSSSIVSNFLTYACVAGTVLLGGSLVREMDTSLHSLERNKIQRETETQQIIAPPSAKGTSSAAQNRPSGLHSSKLR